VDTIMPTVYDEIIGAAIDIGAGTAYNYPAQIVIPMSKPEPLPLVECEKSTLVQKSNPKSAQAGDQSEGSERQGQRMKPSKP
jgi:hypothetical protein